MGVVARKGLVAALRSRISDDRAAATAFALSVTGECKSALLEIANGVLSVKIEGGQSVRDLRLNLSDPRYNTLGRLVNEISRTPGYDAKTDPQYQPDHPSNDLRIEDGLVQIGKGKSYTLRHRIFSDEELSEFLSEAVSIHNPNYTINAVPANEHSFVLMKASAHAYRVLAADTSRRRGLDTDAKTLLALAQDLETQYDRDSRRNHRILPVPKIDDSSVGSGEVIQGQLTRRSARAGYTTSYRDALPSKPPTLLDPSDDDIEDTLARLRWSQDRDQRFSYYELWRDTQSKVERSVSGRLDQRPGSSASPQLPINTQYMRMSTSIQILGLAVSANRVAPVFDGFFFWTAAELAGSNIVNVNFVDGILFPNPGGSMMSVLGEPLEAETDYYYRLYAVNWNGEVQHSNVIKVRTRPYRARFKRTATKDLDPTAIDVTTGPLAGGTTVTILGTDFVEGTEVYFGGKKATEVSRTSTQLVVTTPAFTNADFKNKPMDVVLKSTTGLMDIVKSGWVYT